MPDKKTAIGVLVDNGVLLRAGVKADPDGFAGCPGCRFYYNEPQLGPAYYHQFTLRQIHQAHCLPESRRVRDIKAAADREVAAARARTAAMTTGFFATGKPNPVPAVAPKPPAAPPPAPPKPPAGPERKGKPPKPGEDGIWTVGGVTCESTDSRLMVFGAGIESVIRWMGSDLWSIVQVRATLALLSIKPPFSDAKYARLMSEGRKRAGKLAKLSSREQDLLNTLGGML